MNTGNCKYHPLEFASQYCEHCQVSYCESCSDESGLQNRRNPSYRCYVCESSTRPLEQAFKVDPFWRRLPAVYRYPLNFSGSMLILVTALLSAVLIDAFVFVLIPAILITIYCFACLNETASGNMQAPAFDKCFDGSASTIFYVYICLIVAAFVTSFAFAAIGPGTGMLATVFCVVVLPAAIMIIAIDDSLAMALNPAKLIGIVTTTGTSYFVMLLFVMIMISSLAAVGAVFGEFQESFMSRFLHSAITNYYSIVVFHIMGYLVYQNSFQLGFATHNTDLDTKSRSTDAMLESKIEILAKAGRFQDALELCQRQLRSQRDGALWKWERCFNLMFASRNPKKISKFTDKFLSMLHEQEQFEKMAESYLRVKSRVADFLPEDHAVRLSIATELNEIGKNKSAINVLNRFHESCKDTSQIVSSFGLLSEAFARIPGQEARATLYRRQFEMLSKKTNGS